MRAELAALREHVHKLMLVGQIVASHRIKQLHSLRLLERHAAWRRNSMLEKQRRTGGRVYLIEDPEPAIST